MTLYIAPIIEGHSEAKCIERLLQRLWGELLACSERLQVLLPSRGKRDALLQASSTALANKVEEAYLKLAQVLSRDPEGRGLLLLLLDAEKGCPALLAPPLLVRARQARSNADITCVLAKQMLENWIVAGASTLAGVCGLPDPLPARSDVENLSGAAWLDARFRSVNRAIKYDKTAHALALVRKMDLDECRAGSPSFDKLCRELEIRLPPAATEPLPEADQQEDATGDDLPSA
jgi:hypothetical protein